MFRKFSWMNFLLLVPLVTHSSDFTLKEVIEKKSRGIDSEFENSLIWKDQTKKFILYKKKKLTDVQAGLSEEECQKPNASLFCAVTDSNWKMSYLRAKSENEIESSKRLKLSKSDYDQIYSLIKASDFSTLSELGESEFLRILKRKAEPEDYKKIAKAQSESDKCAPVEFLTALGMKLEVVFPDPEAIQLSMSMFNKSIECAKDQKSTSLGTAYYRLALLYLLNENCKLADQTFDSLLQKNKDDRYLSRAYYWKAYCAQKSGNKLIAEVYRHRLLKIDPLGFHTAFALKDQVNEPSKRFINDIDIAVKTRSKFVPGVNDAIRAIEALEALNASHLGNEYFQFVKFKMKKLEPEILLYLSYLNQNAREYINAFQMLTQVYINYPTLINKQVLELIFPKKYFNQIKSKVPASLNPLLVMSLIRQESAFHPTARSPVGARGLMQLMPSTARKLGVRSTRLLNQPEVNLRTGIRYFLSLIKRFGGDAHLALAAYNAGPNRVDEWLKRYPTSNRLLFLDFIPYSETRAYISLISRNYFWYQNLYKEDANSFLMGSQRGLASIEVNQSK